MSISKILKTDRLVLRPFKLSDAVDVQRLAGEFEIADTTLLIPHPYEAGMAEEWIRSHKEKITKKEALIFAIVIADTDQLVGSIELRINADHENAELGYWIGKPYWNKGIATEAAKAILKLGFVKLKLERIHAHYLSRNQASGKVMHKIGMQYEGTLRKHAKKWDKLEDMEMYGILKLEFKPEYASTN
jgi:RimJ/RimL family protein N-acetyltransferase